MLDRDLARLYGVEARALNQAVQRNIERFPDDFMFQLSKEEFENWKSQIAISNNDSSRIVSYCSVLVSVLFCLFPLYAMQVSIACFVYCVQILSEHRLLRAANFSNFPLIFLP